ncbi:MAG: hypothetical protein WAV89_06765 [Ignavibacteriaceae bacterium]
MRSIIFKYRLIEPIISKNILIFFLLLFFSCIEKKADEVLVKREPEVIEINEQGFKKITLSSKDFINNKSLIINEEKNYVGTWNFSYLSDNKYFLISPDNCTAIIIDKTSKKTNSFCVKGKGLGLIKYINASCITDTSIVFYDSSLRKFVEYSYIGKFIKEIINDASLLPYHISGMVYNKFSIFCVGIDNNGYQEYQKKKEYSNFFKFDYPNLKVFSKNSFLPDNFSEYLKAEDIAANPVSNPFNINMIDNKIYIYDWVSGQVTYFTLDDDYDATRIKLNSTIFQRHIPLTIKNNTSKLSSEWFKSGAYLNNIFEDEKFLIIYFTVFNNRTDKIDKNILFIDKASMKLKYTFSTDEDKHLKFIDSDNLIFIGYENLEEFKSGSLTLYKINYKKLF